MANKTLATKHAYLRFTHQETTQNLLKARRYEERFVKVLNTEGVEELNKVVTLSRELEAQSKKIKNRFLPSAFKNTFTTWQDQLTATAQYLKVLAHRTSAYLRLEVETVPIASIIQQAVELLQIQEIGCVPEVTLQNYLKAEALEADLAKIKQRVCSVNCVKLFLTLIYFQI